MGSINSAFAGFGPQYLEGVRKNAEATLLPQEEEQFRGQNRNLVSSLGNAGLLKSSAAREAGGALNVAHARGQISVENQAQDQANQAAHNIQQQKTTLTNQLVTSEDPALAAQQAVTSAAGIQAPSIIAPLGSLFNNFANTYLANRIGSAGFGINGAYSGYGGSRMAATSLGSNFIKR